MEGSGSVQGVSPQLLDVTLREGSYVVDFQFSTTDTATIAALLDESGIPYIEVGHGLGVGGERISGMAMPEPAESYFAATQANVKSAKWGVFAIPGVATFSDVAKAKDQGAHFLRVGTNVTETREGFALIEFARSQGLEVFANYMKTYALSPGAVAQAALESTLAGAHHICIVDSAGGMLPEDVSAYVQALVDVGVRSFGFHGHNNLGLANANSILAQEMGATFIDASVRGLGRSSGNALTESLVLLMRRRGISDGIDLKTLFSLSDKVVRPFAANFRPLDSIEAVCGFAQFHSGFLSRVIDVSNRYAIDPRDLIMRSAERDKVHLPDDLLESVAMDLVREQEFVKQVPAITLPSPRIPGVVGFEAALGKLIHRVSSLGRRSGGTPVVVVDQAFDFEEPRVSDVVNQSDDMVIGNIRVKALGPQFFDVISAIRDNGVIAIVDDALRHPELDPQWEEAVENAILYSQREVWVRAVSRTCRQLAGRSSFSYWIDGDQSYRAQLLASLSLAGGVESPNDVGILIHCRHEPISLSATLGGFMVVDALASGLALPLEEFDPRAESLYRVDMHPDMAAECALLVRQARGARRGRRMDPVIGEYIYSGGQVAPRRALIVDSIVVPSRVVALADGRGGILGDAESIEELRRKSAQVEALWALAREGRM